MSETISLSDLALLQRGQVALQRGQAQWDLVAQHLSETYRLGPADMIMPDGRIERPAPPASDVQDEPLHD